MFSTTQYTHVNVTYSGLSTSRVLPASPTLAVHTACHERPTEHELKSAVWMYAFY